jgi:hypothetical protein
MISYQTYYGGYLDLKETTFLDEKCKTSYTSVNRWVAYRFLSSSDEQTGEIHLEVKTRRILSYTSDWTPPELPGLPHIGCNIEMGDDYRKEECKTFFDTTGAVPRYVTLNLTTEGLQPFLDIDSAGTTEETRSTRLAPYVLKMLDAIEK